MLQRAEDVFDSASSDGHCIRLPVESTLHNFQYMFVLPSSDAAIVAGRTSFLEMATGAGTGPVHPQIHVMFNSGKSIYGALASRASIQVAFRHIDEVGLREQTFLP